MAKKPYYCDDCGTRNTPDSKYCKECGARMHVVYQTLALSDYDRIDDPTEQERLTQLLDMAFWHNEAGNTDAAIRAASAALAIHANSTTAHSLLGCLYEKKGDNEKAVEHFENVLALNPGSEADRAKLEQLRVGVHVRPVRPSPVYRWIPSVFGTAAFTVWMQGWRDRFADMRRPQSALLSREATPAIVAGCAAVLVLAVCLFLIKPAWRSGVAEAAVSAQPIGRSAFAAAPPGPDAAPTASQPRPVVMEPQPIPYSAAPPPSIVAEVPNNPFAGAPPAPVDEEPLLEAGRSFGSARSPRGGSLRLKPLPRLGSVFVPNADEGPLPPAPVSGPVSAEPNAPIPADSDIARHTVVVHHFNGLSEFSAPSVRPASDNGSDAAPEPPSRIEITVDPAPDTQEQSSSSAAGGGGAAPSGESLQQSAFALQQQGDDRQAAALYQKAISAYEAQIAAGEDRDVAERGLQACQTGLQICRQNQ